jgi:hypothetical protein
MSKNVIVVGNKPLENIDLSFIIDEFDEVYRCNMAFVDSNNGTKRDFLGLCNHLYDKLIKNSSSYDIQRIINSYKNSYKEESIRSFFTNFQKTKHEYKSIFYARPKGNMYNKYLKKHGCPHFFSKQPRTGFVIMMENLLLNNKVSISHFSIYDEIRVSHYVKKTHYESSCHSSKDELKILRWLHQNNLIDASLCLLKNEEFPTFKCVDLFPTDLILDKFRQKYHQLPKKDM